MQVCHPKILMWITLAFIFKEFGFFENNEIEHGVSDTRCHDYKPSVIPSDR
jgi:hypothetical protein